MLFISFHIFLFLKTHRRPNTQHAMCIWRPAMNSKTTEPDRIVQQLILVVLVGSGPMKCSQMNADCMQWNSVWLRQSDSTFEWHQRWLISALAVNGILSNVANEYIFHLAAATCFGVDPFNSTCPKCYLYITRIAHHRWIVCVWKIIFQRIVGDVAVLSGHRPFVRHKPPGRGAWICESNVERRRA